MTAGQQGYIPPLATSLFMAMCDANVIPDNTHHSPNPNMPYLGWLVSLVYDIFDAIAMTITYNGDDQQLAQVKWEKYMRTLQVKMAPDYNFSTKSVSL